MPNTVSETALINVNIFLTAHWPKNSIIWIDIAFLVSTGIYLSLLNCQYSQEAMSLNNFIASELHFIAFKQAKQH